MNWQWVAFLPRIRSSRLTSILKQPRVALSIFGAGWFIPKPGSVSSSILVHLLLDCHLERNLQETIVPSTVNPTANEPI